MTVEEIPQSLWEKCRKAAAECPNNAIVIET
ncbi:MAG: ferredoxin [Desulfatiglandales bacterium]